MKLPLSTRPLQWSPQNPSLSSLLQGVPISSVQIMRYNYKPFSYESAVNILSIYFIEIKCINLKKRTEKSKP